MRDIDPDGIPCAGEDELEVPDLGIPFFELFSDALGQSAKKGAWLEGPPRREFHRCVELAQDRLGGGVSVIVELLEDRVGPWPSG